jgi:hypothetical protein
MTTHGEPIRSRLIEDCLQQMWQTRCKQCREKNVIRNPPPPTCLAARVDPLGRHQQEMLVGTPCEGLRGFLGGRRGVRRDRIRNRDIRGGWAYRNEGHLSLFAGQDLLQHLPRRARDHAAFVRIALGERDREVFRLL